MVALRGGFPRGLAGVARMVAADPAIDLDAVAAFAAQQLIHRHAERLALDVPHGLLDARDRTGQDGAAAVEARAVHLLERILDVRRASYDSFLVLYVVRGRGYCYLDSQRVELHTGSLVLLDCYLPHRYGYGSDSTFCTTFKRITGMTPLEYRNQR